MNSGLDEIDLNMAVYQSKRRFQTLYDSSLSRHLGVKIILQTHLRPNNHFIVMLSLSLTTMKSKFIKMEMSNN